MDRGHGLIGEEVLLHTSDAEMMRQIRVHFLLRERLQVPTRDDARRQGPRLPEQEIVDGKAVYEKIEASICLSYSSNSASNF